MTPLALALSAETIGRWVGLAVLAILAYSIGHGPRPPRPRRRWA